MSFEAQYASLLAFVEARDTQLTLPFAGPDCGRNGGLFAPGNTCASGSSSPSAESSPRPRRPGADPVSGGPRSNTSNGFPPAWGRDRSLSHTGSLPGLPKIASIKVDNPKQVKGIATESGFTSVASLVKFGAADSQRSEVEISSSIDKQRTASGTIDSKSIKIESRVPVYVGGEPSPGQRPAGHASIEVELRKREGDPPYAYYGHFVLDSGARAAINREKDSSPNKDSAIERTLGASIMDKMLASLEEAEKAGAAKAVTFAAGSQANDTYKGYRLWGRFGFDAELQPSHIRKITDAMASHSSGEPILSPENENKLRLTGTLTLQELLGTKAGEKWWSQNGNGLNLTLDFSDKESAGYQRFRKMLDRAKRAKNLGSRAFEQFCEFAATAPPEIAEWRGFADAEQALECRIASLMAFAQARNCGTGSGGFQAGNTCAGGKLADAATGAAKGAIKGAAVTAGVVGPIPHIVAKGAAAGAAAGAVKGLFDNAMEPTRVMKKITKIGSSEKQVSSLVSRLGGSPNSVARLNSGKLTLHVKNERGEKIFEVELGEKKFTISPSRKSGTLSSSEMAQVKKIAEENSPKEVSVVVKSRSPSYAAKLVRKGFSVAANAAGTLLATVVLPMSPSLAVGVVAVPAEILKSKKI